MNGRLGSDAERQLAGDRQLMDKRRAEGPRFGGGGGEIQNQGMKRSKKEIRRGGRGEEEEVLT